VRRRYSAKQQRQVASVKVDALMKRSHATSHHADMICDVPFLSQEIAYFCPVCPKHSSFQIAPLQKQKQKQNKTKRNLKPTDRANGLPKKRRHKHRCFPE
jgi:uncharacterized Zn finger protein (UPF0148 family)